jgi:hypothetical protein
MLTRQGKTIRVEGVANQALSSLYHVALQQAVVIERGRAYILIMSMKLIIHLQIKQSKIYIQSKIRHECIEVEELMAC